MSDYPGFSRIAFVALLLACGTVAVSAQSLLTLREGRFDSIALKSKFALVLDTPDAMKLQLVDSRKAFTVVVPFSNLKRLTQIVTVRDRGILRGERNDLLTFTWNPDLVIATFEAPDDEVCEIVRRLLLRWKGEFFQTVEAQERCPNVRSDAGPARYLLALAGSQVFASTAQLPCRP